MRTVSLVFPDLNTMGIGFVMDVKDLHKALSNNNYRVNMGSTRADEKVDVVIGICNGLVVDERVEKEISQAKDNNILTILVAPQGAEVLLKADVTGVQAYRKVPDIMELLRAKMSSHAPIPLV